MAIGADDAIKKFGTADEVSTGGGTSLVDGDGGISTTSDIDEWTDTDDAWRHSFVLEATWAAVPDTGVIELWVTLPEVQGTNDEPTMDATFDGFFIGARRPDEVATKQYLAFPPVELPSVKSQQVYQFYIRNAQGDAAHDISAGWKLYVTPITPGT